MLVKCFHLYILLYLAIYLICTVFRNNRSRILDNNLILWNKQVIISLEFIQFVLIDGINNISISHDPIVLFSW